MTTINRLRLRVRRALHHWRARRLIAFANRLLARAGRPAVKRWNPGYDELGHPVFLLVMLMAALVLLFDVSDALQHVGAFIADLGEFVQAGA